MLKYSLTCHTEKVTLSLFASLTNKYIAPKDIDFLLRGVLCFFLFFYYYFFCHIKCLITIPQFDFTYEELLEGVYRMQEEAKSLLQSPPPPQQQTVALPTP